ncbi:MULTISPECIES: hypothetical protein [unclassified Nocardia]|uniref:hypothetical protein n=1 Tax=unclassified Nocardia TaxID=2637762 RepID=UPI001CE46B44|nr:MULTISPECIES: hypothetical protein [unclassified Nocardia]
MNRDRALIAAALGVILMTGSTLPAHADTGATVTIDFNAAGIPTPATSIGTSITGYGQGDYITNSQNHRARMAALAPRTLRMELAYATPGDPASHLQCGGGDCATDQSADDWVAAMVGLGAAPIIVLPLDGRHAAQLDVTDAVNIYKHFAATATPVTRFIVGNELDNDQNPKHMAATEYSSRFNQINDALKGINPNITIGGPATASYNTGYLDTFLVNSGQRADFIDIHDYGRGGGTNYSDADLLGMVVRGYGTTLADMRARIDAAVPGRGLGMQIGEFNLSWSGDPRTLTHFNTVWGAAVLGTILGKGAVALQFGDKNGQLGLTSENGEGGFARNQPLPIYHGIGMFTGEGLFRSFGSAMIPTKSDTATLYAFASTNQRNIVLVNTATAAQPTTINYQGLSAGSAVEWQSTDANANAPQNIGTIAIDGTGPISLTLPPMSVTTIVIG